MVNVLFPPDVDPDELAPWEIEYLLRVWRGGRLTTDEYSAINRATRHFLVELDADDHDTLTPAGQAMIALLKIN